MTEPRAAYEVASDADELRDFMRVLRQALLMIVRYIEKRYAL